MEFSQFDKFLAEVRRGDDSAAELLVRKYEPYIRRAVRLRLADERLRRVFDSMDICQSILAEFFKRAADGQFELPTPDRLRRLLVTMALNKLRTKARVEGINAGSIPDDLEPASADSSPSDHVAKRELIEEIRSRLTETERRLLDLRAEGRSWDEIAHREGKAAAAVRMQLTRAIARVRRSLKIGEHSHE